MHLLEENSIFNKKFLCKDPVGFPPNNPKVVRLDHKMLINNHEVYAVFESYIETAELYLKDAWVITR